MVILIILSLNGVISFSYALLTTDDTTILWAMFTVNFLFYTGITQACIIFSTIMRITKAGWGNSFSRVGERITLSSFPLTVITFVILYVVGIDHIFYWLSNDLSNNLGHSELGGGLLMLFNKRVFFWRNILSMLAFYGASYLYFRSGFLKEREIMPSLNMNRRLNILASLVIISYIITNTTIAWDFGMNIILHWESTILPPYFWVGNIFSGIAFLIIVSIFCQDVKGKEVMDGETLRQMGKFLLGNTLLWIYMFWAQYIVLWYGDIPRLAEPLFRQMGGAYSFTFYLMIAASFLFPFILLIQRWVRSSGKALPIVVVLICIGIWVNRYLMIIPHFSDGGRPVFLPWTGVSLTLAGLALTLISVITFFRLTKGVFR